jgi:hypothetical protein
LNEEQDKLMNVNENLKSELEQFLNNEEKAAKSLEKIKCKSTFKMHLSTVKK